MSQQPLLDRFLHHVRSADSVSEISQQILLFGLGALKFLSSNRVVCGTLVQCSIVGALAKISETVHVIKTCEIF